jgi:hypothetical protein
MQPNTVETVIAYLPTGTQGSQEKWKYSRYSDNPQFWSAPDPSSGSPQDVMTLVDGNINLAGAKQAVTTVKTQPVPDESEAYNLSQDPLELVNLTHSTDPTVMATISELETMLHQQCQAKLLKPSSGTVPGQPDC